MDFLLDRVLPPLALLLLWLFLIAPGRSDRKAREPFVGRTFAHRGLYTADQSLPENSLGAFMKAVEAGYGVELDVQLTKDGQVAVFHDETMDRACGVPGRVDGRTYGELLEIPLFQTEWRIPLFSDVLRAIDGKVPIIVEIKAGGDWEILCEKTKALLAGYSGAYCIESFHPRVVRWAWKNMPGVLRGQLSEAYRFSSRFLPAQEAFMMSRLLTNFLTRPQFIAYRIGPKCLSPRLCERMGAVAIAWTARTPEDWGEADGSDGVIFEHCLPSVEWEGKGERHSRKTLS